MDDSITLCRIQIHLGEKTLTHYTSRDEFVLGRASDVDIQIPANSASRRHFQLLVKGRSLWVEDLNSSNGTRVGPNKLEAGRAFPYRQGERIYFGPTEAYVTVELYVMPLNSEDEVDAIMQEALLKSEFMQSEAQRQANELLEEKRLIAENHANEIFAEADRRLKEAKSEAESLLKEAKEEAETEIKKAKQEILSAKNRARELTQQVESQAQEVIDRAQSQAHQTVAEAN